MEAHEHIGHLQPLQESIQQARVLIERRQYEHAIQMLTHPIEVQQEFAGMLNGYDVQLVCNY